MRARLLLLVALALAAGAAGCATSSGSGSPATPAGPAPTVTTTRTVPAAPTTSAASATPPATGSPSSAAAGSAGAPQCRTDQLRVSLGGGEQGLSNSGRELVLRNRSDATCVLFGYPGVGLRDAHGRLLALTVSRGSTYFAPDPPARSVALVPGAVGVAALGWNDAGGSADRCVSGVTALQVTPPDQTSFQVIAFGSGRGSLVCDSVVTRISAGPPRTR